MITTLRGFLSSYYYMREKSYCCWLLYLKAFLGFDFYVYIHSLEIWFAKLKNNSLKQLNETGFKEHYD